MEVPAEYRLDASSPLHPRQAGHRLPTIIAWRHGAPQSNRAPGSSCPANAKSQTIAQPQQLNQRNLQGDGEGSGPCGHAGKCRGPRNSWVGQVTLIRFLASPTRPATGRELELVRQKSFCFLTTTRVLHSPFLFCSATCTPGVTKRDQGSQIPSFFKKMRQVRTCQPVINSSYSHRGDASSFLVDMMAKPKGRNTCLRKGIVNG